jgi:hypothetical protein
VAGLVDPVEPQDVAEQRVELGAVTNVLDVVQLGEPLDHAREQQRGQRRRGEDHVGDRLAPGDEPARRPEPLLELRAGAAQHLLVLDLLLGEAHQRPQAGLVAVDVTGGVGQHHRDDVLLDEGEDVAVAVAADLVQRPLPVVVQAGDAGHAGDALGQERLGEVEVAALEAVVDGPGVLDRPVQAGGIAVLVGEHGTTSSSALSASTVAPAGRGAHRRPPPISTTDGTTEAAPRGHT